MKSTRILLAAAVFMSLAGLAFVAQQIEAPGTQMVTAAQTFQSSMTAEQKAQASFAFDSKERTNWNFVPLQDKNRKPTRKGLALAEMTPEQKKAALALVKAGTSDVGLVTATTIMTLENILREQEAKGSLVRDPGWYFVTIFGSPARTGRWGWRIEGHHLSLNFTMDGTQIVSATPCFFGSNPAEIKGGPAKGKRVLAGCEDLAIELFKSLDADQQKVAHQAKHFPEPGQKEPAPKLGPPVGLAAAKMTDAQRDTLWKLLQSFTVDRMAPSVAELQLKRVKDAGLEKVHFAFSGTAELGKGHTYRVQGPTFVIEFLNIQNDSAGNPANHIHSCWREIKGDFGLE